MPVLCLFVFSSSCALFFFLCLDNDIYFWNIFWKYVLIFAFVCYIDSHLLKHSWNINNFWMYGHMTASEDHFKLINSFKTLLYFFVKKKKTKLIYYIKYLVSWIQSKIMQYIGAHMSLNANPCAVAHMSMETSWACLFSRVSHMRG